MRSGLFVGLAALGVAGGGAAREGARECEGDGSRGLIVATGVEMLAWDTSHLGDDALAVVTTAPPGFSGVTGNLPQIGYGAELEYGADGVLYVNDAGNNSLLHRLNPDTGAHLGTITLVIPGVGDVITAMEWIDGLIWVGITAEGGGGEPSYLGYINPANAFSVSAVADTGINNPWGGIAYRGGDVMYVVTAGGSQPRLYTVSFLGAATLIGTVMEGANTAPEMSGLEFGPDGQLYAVPSVNSPRRGELFLINPANGQALSLGQTGNPGLVGLTTRLPTGCNAADIAPPMGALDFSDVFAFLTAFGAGCP